MDLAIRGRVSTTGRVVLPADLRKEFGIEDGSVVIFTRTEHGIEVKSLKEAIRQAQQICKKYITPGESIVDELIGERREEAACE